MSTILAGCIIRDSAGKILLIHRNTPVLVQWELPGGKLEAGEDAATAAAREALEEVCLAVRIVREIGQGDFDDRGIHWEYHWFLAEIIKGTPKIGEPDRYDGIGYFDLDDPALLAGGCSPNLVNLQQALADGSINF